MATKSIRIARHVYLRTQQRQLHQVKSILIRNLALPEPNYYDPLDVSIYFSVHSTYNPKRVLYKSETIKETNNPSWESLEFSSRQFGKYASLATFIIRLWVRSGPPDNDYCLAHERTVEMTDLSYLGSFVNKDGSGYPPNSIVFGMFEGYYSYPGVGGVPCPPMVTHSLSDFLPPQSLLEVHKSEVRDSYQHPVLTRILNRQEVLNRARVSSQKLKHEVESHAELERTYFSQRSAREQLRTRMELLRRQLAEQEAMEDEESKKFSELRNQLDAQENDLRKRQETLRRSKLRYEADSLEHSKQKDQLARAKRNQQLRQRNMIFELTQTYFIKKVDENCYTVCNVILPHADQLDQPSSVEQLGVALGYVSGLVYHLARVLVVPLQYPIKPNGSRSSICDRISDETFIDNIKEFPLFARGSEKALFHYAVYLLNKDIAQIRQYCGYGTSKSMFKKTLPNLKNLLDKITKDVATPQRPDVRMSLPINAASLSSYMGRGDSISLMSSMATTTSTRSHSPGPDGYQFMPAMFMHTTSQGSPNLSFAIPLSPSQEGSPGGEGRVTPHVESESVPEEDREGVLGVHTSREGSPPHLMEVPVPVVGKESGDDRFTMDRSHVDGARNREQSPQHSFREYHDKEPFPTDETSQPRPIPSPSTKTGSEPKLLSLSDAGLLATKSEEQSPSDPDERLPSSLDTPEYTSTSPPEKEHSPCYHDDVEDAAQLVLGLISGSLTHQETFSSEDSQGLNGTPPSDPFATDTNDLKQTAPSLAMTGRDALPHTEESTSYGNKGVAMIPPEIALALRQIPETSTPQVSYSENINRFHSELHAAAHKVRYATYGDSGMIKTGVATPHIITNQDNETSQTGNPSGRTGQTGSSSGRTVLEPSHLQTYSSSQYSDSDAQFLEDFIDSPSSGAQPRTSVGGSDSHNPQSQ